MNRFIKIRQQRNNYITNEEFFYFQFAQNMALRVDNSISKIDV